MARSSTPSRRQSRGAPRPWPPGSSRPAIMPGAEHLISYHILTEGRCFGGLIGEEQVELGPGDVIVFPHGDPHLMSSVAGSGSVRDVSSSAPTPLSLHPPPRRSGTTASRRSSAGSSAATAGRSTPCSRRCHAGCTCGACRTPGMAPSLASSAKSPVLGRAGADTVLTRLAELMFIEVLRRYLDELAVGTAPAGSPASVTKWSAGR